MASGVLWARSTVPTRSETSNRRSDPRMIETTKAVGSTAFVRSFRITSFRASRTHQDPACGLILISIFMLGFMMHRNTVWAFSSIAILLVVGCSRGSTEGRKPVYRVSGKVTMSGGPVANAMVTFSPKQQQPVAIGRTDANGQFTLMTYDAGDGAAEGEFVVLVSKASASKPAGPTGHDPSKLYDSRNAHSQANPANSGEPGLPEKYSRIDQSDLRVKVEKSGKNDFNLELKP